MISKISVNYGLSNNSPVKKTNLTTPLVSQAINKQNYTDNVSFEGIGFLFKAGIRRTPKTVEEVMKRLEKEIEGVYGRENGIFTCGTSETTKEAVFKEHPTLILKGRIPRYRSFVCKNGEIHEFGLIAPPPHGYIVHYLKSSSTIITRTGLSPSKLIGFLKSGLEEITMIADNGIQKLTLPAEPRERTSIIEQLKASESAKSLQTAEMNSQQNVPPNYAEYLWGLAQELSKDIKGIKLEITRPAEIKPLFIDPKKELHFRG